MHKLYNNNSAFSMASDIINLN